MGADYTADNSRMLAEIGAYQFWDLRRSIEDLYLWYARHETTLDHEALQFDERIKNGVTA
jgi:hypothetical protein